VEDAFAGTTISGVDSPPRARRSDDRRSTKSPETVFQTLCGEPYIYLLPEYEDASSQQKVVEEFWPEFEALE